MKAWPTETSLFLGAEYDEWREWIRGLIVEVVDGRLYRYSAVEQFHDAAAKAFGLQHDLADWDRARLLFDCNVQLRQGYRRWQGHQNSASLTGFPARELKQMVFHPLQIDWDERWSFAGGRSAGRKLALWNDPVWTGISSFGVPYYFSALDGMNWLDVRRRDAVALGVITEDEAMEPQHLEAPHAIFFFDALPNEKPVDAP